MSAPDVIVGWLQNDYGKLGRAGEAIAHSLVSSSAAGRVAYVEPFLARSGRGTARRAQRPRPARVLRQRHPADRRSTRSRGASSRWPS